VCVCVPESFCRACGHRGDAVWQPAVGQRCFHSDNMSHGVTAATSSRHTHTHTHTHTLSESAVCVIGCTFTTGDPTENAQRSLTSVFRMYESSSSSWRRGSLTSGIGPGHSGFLSAPRADALVSTGLYLFRLTQLTEEVSLSLTLWHRPSGRGLRATRGKECMNWKHVKSHLALTSGHVSPSAARNYFPRLITKKNVKYSQSVSPNPRWRLQKVQNPPKFGSQGLKTQILTFEKL